MEQAWIAMVVGLLVLLASMASVELGISVALIEISLGVAAGNFLGLSGTPWMDFLAGLAGIVLTFLAGAEVDPDLLRERLKESVLIGGLSFLLPFAGAAAVCYYALGWSANAALIAGTALSTTSLAVVYAVLVETGLTETTIGKMIMASTFVTDFGTALALSLLFLRPTWWLFPFILGSAVIIWAMPRLHPWFFPRYGNRVIEPEIKGALAALLVLMFFAHLAESHAVLPAFILGLAVARIFNANRETQRRFRVVAFALLTPFFFLKSGMSVSLGEVWTNLGLLVLLLAVKQTTKFLGVYPVARRYVPAEAMYTTLLMSTGLTFGTIASLFGLQAGYITSAQFSVLVTVVVLSAIIPTFIAQRWFEPPRPPVHENSAVSPEPEPAPAGVAELGGR
ncbi:MAG TPA: cation:proton antiporter [Candidatus Methylomirabilis sp.]|nr:cation:proton antiporter [Candidatus Methylomirabilis sp.]